MKRTQQVVNLQSPHLGVFAVAFGRLHGALTSSATTLADGDVITVLVLDLPRVYAHPKGRAFVAVKHDDSVVTWGDARFGGETSIVKSKLSGGVDRVIGTEYAFAAVKQDGSVVTWGRADFGGDSVSVQDQLTGVVRHVFGNDRAFAALKEDGSVVAWEMQIVAAIPSP